MRRSSLFPLLLVLGAALLSLFIEAFGHRQFGGFDHSVMVDLAYRFSQGQTYWDFYQTTPVVFWLGADLAQAAFGLSWSSLVHVTALFSVTVFSLQCWALRRSGMPPLWALATAFTTQMLSCVFTAYWWYNCVTASLGALFASLTFLVLRSPRSLVHWGAFAAGASAMLLAKPNVAFPLTGFAGFALLLTFDRKTIFRAAAAGALSLAVVAIVTGRYGTDPLAVLEVYRGVGARAWPSFSRFAQDQSGPMVRFNLLLLLVSLPAALLAHCGSSFTGRAGKSSRPVQLGYLAACLLIAVCFVEVRWELCAVAVAVWLAIPALRGGISRNPRQLLLPLAILNLAIPLWLFRSYSVPLFFVGTFAIIVGSQFFSRRPVLLLLLGTLWTSWLACFTNGEAKLTDLSLAATALSLLVLAAPQATASSGRRYLGALLAFLSTLGLWFGANRYRVELIGPGTFYEDAVLTPIGEKAAFFSRLRAGPILHRVIDDMKEAVREVRAEQPDARIFFGTRIEFGYAALGLPSPKGLPLWWHPGVSYPPSARSQIARVFEDELDAYVFLEREIGMLPPELVLYLNGLPEQRIGSLSVFRAPRVRRRPS